MSGRRPPPTPIGGYRLPTILVIASDDVQRICKKNNLRFVELLKPFGFQPPGSPPIRLGGRAVAMPTFGVRFVSPEEMDTIDKFGEREDPDLSLCLQKEVPPDRKADGLRDVEDVAGFHRVTPDPTPWFTEYRARFIESLAFSETDFLDHPIGCVIAVSTQDDSPIKLFDNMRAIRNLPKLFQKGHYDSNIYRTYILVHDAQSGLESKQKAEEVLGVMEKTFAQSNSGRVITLNSRTTPDQEDLSVLSGLFRPYVKEQPPEQEYGMLLSADDIHQLSLFIGDFISLGVTPTLNKKLIGLQEKVAAVRRGFRNQVKLLFKGRETKVKAVATGTKTHVMYDLTSAESQIRQLADFSFLLKDYEQALSSYRLVAHDYKSDKAWAHYAGAQEMMGLCLALTNGAQRDMATCFETAFSTYYGNGDLRRASRVAFSAGEALLRSDRAKEASANYLRASEKESGIRGALLLEQAAYTFLHIQPRPLVRKYAFHLVMAGHLYHKNNHNLLGVRCYRSARSVYEGREWFQIEDHLNYHLGRDCFNLADFDAAVHHFVHLIGQTDQQVAAGFASKTQSVEKQKSFLNEFVFVVKKWSGENTSRSIPDLRLPTFLDATVKVLLNDSHTIPSSFAAGIWMNAMKRQPPLTTASDLCNRPVVVYMENFYREKDRVSGVNERIEVEVMVSNPLLMDIAVKDIRLSCVYAEEEASAVEIEPQNLSLEPGGASTLRLGVTCLKKGNLRIEGILWEVCDTINGYHPLVLPDRQTLVKEGNRLKTLMKPTHDLNIPVIGDLPLLHYDISNFPTTLFHGEVVNCVLTLSNRGSLPLRRATVFVSHPMCIVFRKRVNNNSSNNEYVYSDRETSFVCGGCYPMNWENSTVEIEVNLAPGHSVDIDMFLRGAVLGKQNMCLLFRYAMDPENEEGNSRLAVFQRTVIVDPLVNISVFNKHSFAQIYDSVLGVEIEDRQHTFPLTEEERISTSVSSSSSSSYSASSTQFINDSVRIDFTRVSMFSESWKIRALGSSEDSAPPPTGRRSSTASSSLSTSSLTANESLTVFFRVSSIESGGIPCLPPFASSSTSSLSSHKRSSSATLSSLVSTATSDLDPSSSTSSTTTTTDTTDITTIAATSPSQVEEKRAGEEIEAEEKKIEDGMIKTDLPIPHDPPSLPPTSSPTSSSSSLSSTSPSLATRNAPPPPPLTSSTSLSSLSLTATTTTNSTATAAAALASPTFPSSSSSPFSNHPITSVPGLSTSLHHSYVIYSESKLDLSVPPYSTLLRMEKKVMVEEEKHRLIMNPAAVVANVGAPDKLDMVFTWTADNGKRHGFYHLIGLTCLKSQPAACSLKVLVNYTPKVTHDFKHPHQTLTVPVQIQIRNLETQPVSFLFETLSTEEEFDYSKRSFKVHNTSSLMGRYLWGGEVKRQFTRLPPNQVVVLPLTASFVAAGHYNLNRFRLTVQSLDPGGKSRVFFWPLQHLIHVQQPQS